MGVIEDLAHLLTEAGDELTAKAKTLGVPLKDLNPAEVAAHHKICEVLAPFSKKKQRKMLKQVQEMVDAEKRRAITPDALWNEILASKCPPREFFEDIVLTNAGEGETVERSPQYLDLLERIRDFTQPVTDKKTFAHLIAGVITKYGAPYGCRLDPETEEEKRFGYPGQPSIDGLYPVGREMFTTINRSKLAEETKQRLLGEIRRTPPSERRTKFKALLAELETTRASSLLERENNARRVVELEREIGACEAAIAEFKLQKEWCTSPLKLEHPNGSGFHKLMEAAKANKILDTEDPTSTVDVMQFIGNDSPSVFVVEHDWAAAFEGATDFDKGAFRLPFDLCVFEFRLTGRRVIAILRNRNDEVHVVVAIEGKEYWLAGGYVMQSLEDHKDETDDNYVEAIGLTEIVNEQVRAVCISLEAEVAVTEVIRAPEKLNAARAKKGKAPLKDYHVVSLAKRHRAQPLEQDYYVTDTGRRRPRLHFRRGHWRHYEKHRTWVKWCLAGAADLGFINKHYKL